MCSFSFGLSFFGSKNVKIRHIRINSSSTPIVDVQRDKFHHILTHSLPNLPFLTKKNKIPHRKSHFSKRIKKKKQKKKPFPNQNVISGE